MRKMYENTIAAIYSWDEQVDELRQELEFYRRDLAMVKMVNTRTSKNMKDLMATLNLPETKEEEGNIEKKLDDLIVQRKEQRTRSLEKNH